MVQIALLVLAPLLAFFVADRRIVGIVLAVVWGVLMIPQTHVVLLDEQLDIRSMGNTASYFVINELTLVIALALAFWIHRCRHASAVRPVAA